jgi:hypothetical protein
LSSRLLRIAAALALAGIAGCAGKQWQVLPVAPESLGAWAGKLRLTLNDGSRLVVMSPQVRNDSVFGGSEGGPVALALSQVSRVAVEAPNPDKPRATMVVLLAAGLTIISVIALAVLTN